MPSWPFSTDLSAFHQLQFSRVPWLHLRLFSSVLCARLFCFSSICFFYFSCPVMTMSRTTLIYYIGWRPFFYQFYGTAKHFADQTLVPCLFLFPGLVFLILFILWPFRRLCVWAGWTIILVKTGVESINFFTMFLLFAVFHQHQVLFEILGRFTTKDYRTA